MSILNIIGAVLLSGLSLAGSAASPVDKLWQDYEVARKADKPVEEASILTEIKKEAKRSGLVWDYYNACDKYVWAVSRRNWKLRDELMQKREKEISDLKESVAWFYLMRPGADYIKANKKQLMSASHEGFWKNDPNLSRYAFKDALIQSFENDWDYVCFVSIPNTPEFKSEFSGRYPLGALSKFITLEEKDLPSYSAEYSGKAVSLLSRERELYSRFNVPDSTSEYYLKLKEDCIKLNLDCKEYKSGTEKIIAQSVTGAETILKSLSSQELSCSVEDGIFNVRFRNLSDAKVILLKDEKVIWSRNISNTRKSYYAFDTVSVTPPPLEDGTYLVECKSGKLEGSCEYQKYTVSLAIRANSEGTGIYATDYISGEPLKKACIEVFQGDGTKIFESEEIKLRDGFTPLPESVVKVVEGKKKSSIGLRLGTRRSGREDIGAKLSSSQDLDDKPVRKCRILTDRAAYTPDETLCFKIILISGTFSSSPVNGAELKAELFDAEGNLVETKKIVTDEWGCADGKMTLKRCNRGGTYTLTIEDGSEFLANKNVRVEDFVLPSFELVFDQMPDQIEKPVEELRFSGYAAAYSGHKLSDAKAVYTVYQNGTASEEKPLILNSEGTFSITVPVSQNENWYDFYLVEIKITDKSGETHEFSKSVSLARRRDPEKKPTEYFFEDISGRDTIGIRLVSGPERVTWAVAELYGAGNVLLESKPLVFTEKAEVVYPFKSAYPETIKLHVLYFQNKKVYSKFVTLRREDHRYDLKLAFSRFLDTTVPGASYSFSLNTSPDVECAVSIFDKSTETISPNEWQRVSPRSLPVPAVAFKFEPGKNDSGGRKTKNVMIRGLATQSSDEAIPFQLVENKASFNADGAGPIPSEGYLRENFANTIFWAPSLKSDAEGNVNISFKNSDKLSTYYVQVFALDRKMRNEVLRKEMKVTIPVKISLIEPRWLYCGDKYAARVEVSNSSDREVSGKLIFNDRDVIPITVKAGGNAFESYPLETSGNTAIPLKVVFKPEGEKVGSDGVKVLIPIKKASQALTEAHSAILKAGEDKAGIISGLRSSFVNISGEKAVLREISILDMINEAIPEEIEARSENTISLAMAAKSRSLLGMDRSELLSKIDSRRASDGSYAWFDGMESSPIVTAVLLEMLKGELKEETASVKYLDRCFSKEQDGKIWIPWISEASYLYVRSLYPSVKFSEELSKEKKVRINDYLCPKEDRGLEGMVLRKARRTLTLENFLSSAEGKKLAKTFLGGIFTETKIKRSLAADRRSLKEYAVDHASGGVYFPNAVAPWRGLLESELYAHVILCKLFEGTEIADGIRLWFMIQKETQKWNSDPAYIEALELVLGGSEDLKKTSVLSLKGIFEKPFESIKASGNGMTVSEIHPEISKIGDKIKLRAEVRSDEKRSFVRVSIPFPAGFHPVNQISGYCRWHCYRSVLSDRIEYWFQTLPEEKTILEDEFFAVREGSFQTPSASVECSYADHYRANTGAIPLTVIEQQ